MWNSMLILFQPPNVATTGVFHYTQLTVQMRGVFTSKSDDLSLMLEFTRKRNASYKLFSGSCTKHSAHGTTHNRCTES